jgi:putative ABC transport system substrate-binding protein
MSWLGLALCALTLVGSAGVVNAQPPRVYRVGVILQGGPYALAVDGLRQGLKELGFEQGTHIEFHVRDVKGDLKAVEAMARALERDKVDVLFTVATSVTVAAKRATQNIPIVFYAGADPVAFDLVQNFRKPGGRLTGVHGRLTDLTPKRLQLLQEMVPRLRRVVAFYDPGNPAAVQSVEIARDVSRQVKVELVERRVASVDELEAALRALRPADVDAVFYVADAMVASQTQRIIDTANAKKLPTMFQEPSSVAHGALASYGLSYHAVGRLAAKHVHRVLLGANPGDLPVEQLDRLHFAVNLKTAKALGLTIPPSVLTRADEVIE